MAGRTQVQKRKLTEEEKAFLTRWIDTTPLFITPFPIYNERSKERLKHLAYRDLNLRFVPENITRSQLTSLANYLQKEYQKNTMPYGHAVGKEAGTGIGEHTSQITLKLKGNTGTSASSKVVNMSQVFSRLLKAPKSGIENITVRLEKRWKFTELYFNRLKFFSINMKNGNFIKNVEYLNVGEFDEIPDWYDLYSEVFGLEIPTHNRCMRITFNTVNLFSYHLTMQEIVEAIYDSDVGEYVIAVPSPQHIGIIDIFPTDNYQDNLGPYQKLMLGQKVIIKEEKKPKKTKKDEDDDDDNDDEEPVLVAEVVESDEEEDEEETISEEEKERKTQDLYLMTRVRKIINELRFGVDNNIISLSINWDNLSIIIASEEESEGGYKIMFNYQIIREKSIHLKSFDTFFTKRGWTVEAIEGGRFLRPPNPSVPAPTQLLRDATTNPLDFEDSVQPFLQIEGRIEDALFLPGADLSTIVSDSSVSIKRYYGVETARVLLYQVVKDIFKDLYPALVLLLTDFMSFSGEILALDRHGIGKGNGPLTKTAFEEQKASLTVGAMRPRLEPVTVTTSSYLGTEPKVGTGVVTLFKNESFQPPVKITEDTSVSEELNSLRLLRERTDRTIAETTEHTPVEQITPEPINSILSAAEQRATKLHIRKPQLMKRKPIKIGMGEVVQPESEQSNLVPEIIQLKLFTEEDDGDVVAPPVEETPVHKTEFSREVGEPTIVQMSEPVKSTVKPKVKKVVTRIVTKK